MRETGRGVKGRSAGRRRRIQRPAAPGAGALEGGAQADRRGLPRVAQALIIVLVSVPAAVLGVWLGTSSSTFHAPGAGGLPEATALVLPWAGSPLPRPATDTPRASTPTGGVTRPPAGGPPTSLTTPRTTTGARVGASGAGTPAAASPPAVTASPSPAEAAVPQAADEPPFTPIVVQAEDPGNDLLLAETADCAQCDGGKHVEFTSSRGYLVVNADVPVAGNWPLTLTYVTDEARTIRVSVTEGSRAIATLSGAGDGTSPASTTLHLEFPAGPVGIRFDNPYGLAPAIDKVVIG